MQLKSWCSPGQLVAVMLAGWINRHQQAVIAYQKEEIKVLREMLGGKRLRFTDEQRRRLALEDVSHIFGGVKRTSLAGRYMKGRTRATRQSPADRLHHAASMIDQLGATFDQGIATAEQGTVGLGGTTTMLDRV